MTQSELCSLKSLIRENVLENKRKMKIYIEFERFENSNTFVIAKPCEEICKKYQLATFLDHDGREKAHVIIFPFQKREIMDELIADLKNQ